ncbi:MAG: hypothetical protein HY820_31725 [Acidobacteria bacterium]|nr:hypothetical protein [Acidobacteriota bacterium]
MSKLTGDKSRHNRLRKYKTANRAKIRLLRATLALGKRADAAGTAGKAAPSGE